jgi:2-desacetyl-2-hydroxyethyl bacteriochlorophyllide A dehydrogenase
VRAAILEAPERLVPGEIAAPEPAAGESLVRVRHVGLCGTDVKIHAGSIRVDLPRVMGHEIVGEVIRSGAPGTPGEGERVIIDPNTSCGLCFHCRAGQEHLCPNGQLIGRDRDGGLAEYVVAPAKNLHRLPAEIGDEEGPIVQVLATCVHAHRRVGIFPGQSVVVVGLGVAGILHVQLAKARGAHPVIGVTRSAEKRDLARSLGADHTVDARADVPSLVADATNGLGADLAIEAVGSSDTLAQAVAVTRIGGTVLGFGISTGNGAPLRLYDLYFKELSLIHSRATKAEDFASGIDLVQRGVIRLSPLLSHTMGLTEAAAAISLVASARALKVVLDATR